VPHTHLSEKYCVNAENQGTAVLRVILAAPLRVWVPGGAALGFGMICDWRLQDDIGQEADAGTG
jgi:hypothetical protein